MKTSLLIMTVAAIASSTITVLAHEGHDDASAFADASGPASAPVTLSPESIANLGVKTTPAAFKPLAETISLPATITLIPACWRLSLCDQRPLQWPASNTH